MSSLRKKLTDLPTNRFRNIEAKETYLEKKAKKGKLKSFAGNFKAKGKKRPLKGRGRPKIGGISDFGF